MSLLAHSQISLCARHLFNSVIQQISEVKLWTVAKRYWLVTQIPSLNAWWLAVCGKERDYTMIFKLDLFIQNDSSVSSPLNQSNVSPSLSWRHRWGSCGLEPPTSAPSPEKSTELREGSFAAGSLWEVLIVCFATCSLELRENCQPPAVWHCRVRDDCVCLEIYCTYICVSGAKACARIWKL